MKANFFNYFFLILVIFFTSNAIAQNQYAGIEIGGKGLKTFIIDARSIEKGIWVIDKYWFENINILSGIVTTGSLSTTDIETTSKQVLTAYNQLINQYKIDKEKIYIVISSGVSVAKNTNQFAKKIQEEVCIQPHIITSDIESKLLFKGCIPPKYYKESMIMDIGSGNTKGGFIETESGKSTFYDFNMDLGTMSFSNLIYKKYTTFKIPDFINLVKEYEPKLNADVKEMYENHAITSGKKKIYASGGSVWAFFTIFNNDDSRNNLIEFKLEDVYKYDDVLRNDFDTYKALALKNPEIARVFKTFTHENLIASNAILIATLSNIKKIESKKLYFAKQPEISWVVSFISDTMKDGKLGSF